MEERRHDGLDPARAEALACVLGLPFDPAAPLPPFAHQIYFWDVRPAAGLGRDGHPKLGGLVPDLGLPRRMWRAGVWSSMRRSTPGGRRRSSPSARP